MTPVDQVGQELAGLARIIDGLSVATVTTVAGEVLRSRPMLLVAMEPDGTLAFLTHLSSQKVYEIHADHRVNVAFTSPRGDRYVSVSGTGTIARDRARIKRMWRPTYRAWFPGGADDPDAAILNIRTDRIEYWDVPSTRLVRIWGVLKALATRRPAEAGEHHAVVLRRT